MSNKLSLHLNVFSQYRTQIMGIAAIMILICHIVGCGVLLPDLLKKIFTIGNYGVDVFMFVSGLGMYYSINNKSSIYQWYQKRYTRIFVPYFIISIPYCILMFSLDKFSLQDILLNLTTFDFWMHHTGAWFISTVIFLYLITPFLKRKQYSLKTGIIVAATISAVIILISNIITTDNHIISNIRFALNRSLLFFFGYYMANSIKNKECIKLNYILVACALSLILYKFFGVYTALTIPILAILGYSIVTICKSHITNDILTFFGKISLESYLTNIYLGALLKGVDFGHVGYGNYLMYTLVLLIGIPLAYIVNKISNKKNKHITNNNKP